MFLQEFKENRKLSELSEQFLFFLNDGAFIVMP